MSIKSKANNKLIFTRKLTRYSGDRWVVVVPPDVARLLDTSCTYEFTIRPVGSVVRSYG